MRGRGHIFEDLQRLNEMISLRQQGKGPSELAIRYGVDHSTIIYHCKRNGVVMPRGKSAIAPGVSYQPIVVTEKPKRATVSIRGFVILTDETGAKINPGMNYADYVAERKKREEAKRLGKAASFFQNL